LSFTKINLLSQAKRSSSGEFLFSRRLSEPATEAAAAISGMQIAAFTLILKADPLQEWLLTNAF
jgi:hypothetical protein